MLSRSINVIFKIVLYRIGFSRKFLIKRLVIEEERWCCFRNKGILGRHILRSRWCSMLSRLILYVGVLLCRQVFRSPMLSYWYWMIWIIWKVSKRCGKRWLLRRRCLLERLIVILSLFMVCRWWLQQIMFRRLIIW